LNGAGSRAAAGCCAGPSIESKEPISTAPGVARAALGGAAAAEISADPQIRPLFKQGIEKIKVLGRSAVELEQSNEAA
jgi:hypothetical protein